MTGQFVGWSLANAVPLSRRGDEYFVAVSSIPPGRHQVRAWAVCGANTLREK